VLSGPILDRGSAALLAFFPMVSGPESQTLYLSGRYPIIGRSNRPTRGAGVAPRSSRRSFKPLVLSRCSEAFRSAARFRTVSRLSRARHEGFEQGPLEPDPALGSTNPWKRPCRQRAQVPVPRRSEATRKSAQIDVISYATG
jgi:hypothetical protein